MSIYATIGRLWLDGSDHFTNPIEVWIQAVPSHIDYTGEGWDEWLPPPVPEAGPHEPVRFRAVFFVGPGTVKASARNGQEYVEPLLVLTGDEWAMLPFSTIYERLEQAARTGKGGSTYWLEDHWQRTAGYYATRPHPLDGDDK